MTKIQIILDRGISEKCSNFKTVQTVKMKIFLSILTLFVLTNYLLSLITISQALPSGEKSKCDVGKKPENTSKNRYKTTFPCKYISFYNHFKQFCFFLINGLNIFFKMIQKYVSCLYIVCFHIDLSVLFVF